MAMVWLLLLVLMDLTIVKSELTNLRMIIGSGESPPYHQVRPIQYYCWCYCKYLLLVLMQLLCKIQS